MCQATAPSPSTTISDLPLHLQTHLYMLGTAPPTTSTASAAIAADASLTAQWFLLKHRFPLFQAVKHQLWDVCDHLLTTYQHTPSTFELHNALTVSAHFPGSASLVGKLLQWCCKKRCPTSCTTCESLGNILTQASGQGNLPVCSLLVKHASVTPQHARFAVCRAAAGNHLKVMKLLVTSRPDASSPTLFGSPMADAASAGSIEGMQLLMQHGADLRNAPDTAWRCYTRRSTRLLYRAARGGHLPAVRWLLSQGFSKAKVAEAFVGAVEGGHAAIARLLLEHNPCISTHGPMALRAAVCRHDVPIIQLLLEAGVFTQKAWLMRTTGLRSAKDMLDWAGNCMRQLNSDQATALLSTAIEYGHTDFAKLLLEARKAINQKSTIELKAAALKMGDAQLCQMIAM